MARKRDDERKRGAPRSDLPPRRDPYYGGYFGTGEEERVERERDDDEARRERERSIAEDAAGGDREI